MAAPTLNRRTRVWSATIDQIFSSASNGIFTFAVAVVSTTRSFGEIVLMITALLAILGTQRGAVGTPLLLKSDQTTERIRREGSFALLAVLALGSAVLGVMVTFGYAVGLPAILFGVSAPIVLCQDILRYVAIAEGRPHVAATWALAQGISQLGPAVGAPESGRAVHVGDTCTHQHRHQHHGRCPHY